MIVDLTQPGTMPLKYALHAARTGEIPGSCADVDMAGVAGVLRGVGYHGIVSRIDRGSEFRELYVFDPPCHALSPLQFAREEVM